ncbi:MAG TPA: urease accessory protein UreD [Methylomirabilota bacterium]|nr:urease accessory protein UreD [Methylomirabilota bacterium]
MGDGLGAPGAGRVSARRLEGYLKLVCSAGGSGRSFLSEQSFAAPFHLSKPYWDGRVLRVQVINPTAGLFAGDRLRSDVRVGRGARLCFTTPSASRVHAMSSGQAWVEQAFEIEDGGWLEYSPAPLIPQRNSRYRQRTRVEVEAGGELLFLETMAPGRVAHGEQFGFTEVDWELDLRYAGRLLARERYRLRPDDESLAPLRRVFPAAYFASGYVITERLTPEDSCWSEARAVQTPACLVGWSRLPEAGWSLRLVAADPVSLRRCWRDLRALLARRLPELASPGRPG